MPEGPSIVIAKEEMTVFVGKKIIEASGNAKIDIDSMEGKVLTDVKSWVSTCFFVLMISPSAFIFCFLEVTL